MDHNEFDNEKLNKDEMNVNEQIESAQDNVMTEENGSGKKRRKKPGFFGGLIIGVLRKLLGDYPQGMTEVIGIVKKTGTYPYKKILSIPSFL